MISRVLIEDIFFAIIGFVVFSVRTSFAHSLGIHGLQGYDPPNEPAAPLITGAFEAKVSARFDNLAGAGLAGWQIMFETFAAFRYDTIYIGQQGFTNNIQFGVYSADTSYSVVLHNTITEGVEGTWYFGVRADGTLWIKDETTANPIVTSGLVPRNVARPTTTFGVGEWTPPLDPLIGAVTGLQIRNLDEPSDLRHIDLLNMPGQVWGAFTVSFYARFDSLDQASQVLCFSNDDGSDVISFGRHDSQNTTASLVVTNNGISQSLDAASSLIVGEMAFWHVTVDPSGNASIQKNGNAIGNAVAVPTLNTQLIPNRSFRRQQRIGQGCTQSAAENLDGVVLGLRVDLYSSS